MSTTIDNQVVQMQFDNRQFERNVQTSLGTLDKLKQSLNFSGTAKGLEGINTAVSKIDMNSLGNGVEAVRVKFSALQVMAVTALSNITNSAVNAGKRITSALTIEPIKMGFQEYETQLNAVQTILANTQSKGSTLEDVNGALDELNKYADQTIYNFTEMTRNIGTFTAAGVDLDKSVTSIKGIANLAAVSGSTSQQASTAMYQLSQALAAGKVSLMDWNSVVNAGMGGQVFQDALKRTATQMGTNVDALIKKYGSFRESLTQGEWLTAEVLTETLTQLSGAYSEADLIAQGYSEEQAKQIVELAETAVNAATKVKTFTQLVDTTKEALQSGWTQSWEIIIGDFEEAKALWTGVSEFLNEVIEKSAESRNNMLQGWKDTGGRDMAIEAVKNAFQGLLSVIKPIGEAFREVFPPTTSEQLLKITERIRDFTKHLILSDEQSANLKSTFKGLFSIVKMGIDVVTTIGGGLLKLLGAVTGIGSGVLTLTGSFGEWVSGLLDGLTVTEALGKGFDVAAKYIEKFISFVGKRFAAPGYEGLLGIMKSLWDVVSKIGSKIAEVGSEISQSLVNVFRSGDISAGLDILNGGLLAGILMGLKKYVANMAGPFDEVGGLFSNVKEIFDNVRSSLESFQQSLQAETLKKIATAIAILAASILVIAMIDPEKLAASLGAITVLFADLMASMAVFNHIGGAYPKAVKAVTVMIGISSAVLILAAALKVVSTMSLEELATGLVGVLGLTTIVIGAAKAMASGGKTIVKGASQMIIMAAALKVMASACKDLSSLNWEELAKGLVGMTAMMAGLVTSMLLLDGVKFGASTGAGMVLLATSLTIMASAVQKFSGMKWEELAKGLAGMAGALAAVTVAMKLMPKNMVATGAGLLVVSSALVVLSNALGSMGGMSWTEIAKGLAALGGSMLILAGGLKLMTGTLAGSAALLVAAGALAVLTPVLHSLGGMSWMEIAKGLASIAGVFAVLGIAGLALTPLVPTLLALSGAIALLGAGCVGIGAGLTLVAAGISALAVAGTTGAAAIVASITTIVLGIAGLIPALAQRFGEAIIVFCNVIAEGATAIGSAVKAIVLSLVGVLVECVPALADGALKLIVGVLEALVTYSPQIINLLFQFLINVIDGIADRLPELIQAGVNLLSAFFNGIIDALKGIDSTTIVNTILAVGFLSALFIALNALSGLIPGAMAGVLGMGVLIAELSLVLAAIGAFAQIPGLKWLINEGGNFLQAVGNAIGQFVGGIAGGFAEGVTSSFPKLAKDLSAFMENLKPFIEGSKQIDATMASGIKSLASAILVLTAADILNGITSWITGGSSMADFAKELVPFGKALKQYSNEVTGIDAASITGSAKAAKALTQVADAIPNSGGLAGIFAGDNDMSDFANEMVGFGKGMKRYSEAVIGISPTAITASVQSAKMLVNFIKGIGSLNTSGVTSLKTALETLGKTSVDKFVSAFTNSTSKLSTVGGNMMTAVVNGVKSKQSILATTISAVLTNMVKSVKNVENTFEITGNQMMLRFQAGLTKSSPKAIKVLTTMLTNMNKTIRNKRQDFYQAGAYLVDGFANGITANTFKAAAKARLMAKAAIEAAKKELDEHSPSRVTHEIGEFFAIGFLNGIQDKIKEVENTSIKMGETAKDGLAEGLDGSKEIVVKNSEVLLTAMNDAYFEMRKAQQDHWDTLRKKRLEAQKTEQQEFQEYYSTLESTTESFMNKQSLFSSTGGSSTKDTDKKIKKSEELTNSLKDQIKELRRYSIVMDSLNEKLEGTALGEEIRKMGTESIIELEVLNSMTEKELEEYVRLYDVKFENARKAAVTQMDALGHDLSVSENYELQKFQNEILESTKTIISEYTSELDKNTDALMNRANIFAAVNEKEKVTSQQLTQNLQAQVDQLEAYGEVMESLRKRLSGQDLLEAVEEMGVESLAQLEALNSMSAMELTKYAELYEEKFALAKEVAGVQLTELQTETEQKLANLWGVDKVNLDDFMASFDESFESINAYVMKASGIGETITNSIRKAIHNNASIVEDETTITVDLAIDGGNSTAKKLSPTIGRNLVQGFANGISANTFMAEARAVAMAESALAAARQALAVNSPSRKFYEIGDYAGQGFVNALGDYVTKSYKAGSVMASAAKDGLSKAIAKVTDVINGDLDTEPTIRPVIDLTNVQNGVRQINDLLSANQSMKLATANQSQLMAKDARVASIQDNQVNKEPTVIKFEQNNYSPTALSRIDIYRQTKNQFSAAKEVLTNR